MGQLPASMPAGILNLHTKPVGVVSDTNAAKRSRRGEVGLDASGGTDRSGSGGSGGGSNPASDGGPAGGVGGGVGGGGGAGEFRGSAGMGAMNVFSGSGVSGTGERQDLLARQQQQQQPQPQPQQQHASAPLPADMGLSMAAAVASFYNEMPGRAGARHLRLGGVPAGSATVAALGGAGGNGGGRSVGAAGAGALSSPGLGGLDWQQSLQ
ncbi:unnamed protein product, partial [Sphacelaria rigidula]